MVQKLLYRELGREERAFRRCLWLRGSANTKINGFDENI
jgi:hypothetical protein